MFSKPKIRLRLKIIFLVTIVVLTAIGVGMLTSGILFMNEYAIVVEKSAALTGRGLTSRLSTLLDLGMEVHGITGFDLLCEDAVRRNPELSYVYVVGTDGKIIYHSGAGPEGSWSELPSFLLHISPSESFVRRNTIKEGKPYTELILPVTSARSKEAVAFLEMGFSPNFVTDKVVRLITSPVLIGLATFFIEMLLFVILLNTWVAKPLDKLETVIHSVSAKKMVPQNPDLDSTDEIGRLASSFASMMEELHKTTVSREYLDKIIKNILDMLIVVDTEMRIVRVNTAACERLGYSESELSDKPLSFILSDTDSPLTFTNLEKLVEEGKITEKETYFSAKDGKKIPVLFNCSVLTDDEGNIINVICLASDMTERTQSEEKIESLNKLVYQISHQAGMAEIATGILHNIGNILTSINISTEEIAKSLRQSKLAGLARANEMLKQNAENLAAFLSRDPRGKILPEYFGKLADELASEHAQIEGEIRHLAFNVNLVRDVIDAQQRYAWGAQSQDFVGLATAVEDALKIQSRNFFRNEVKIERLYDGDESGGVHFHVKVAKSKLIYILVNVLKNGVEAMADTDPERKTISIGIGQTPGGDVKLTIEDRGEGIAAEHIDSIFNYSFTTKKDGHGFGLHTCAQIIKEIGGSIHAESEGNGKGARFVILFPSRVIEAADQA